MKPVIKWLGGKRLEIKHFEAYFPVFERYVEPFVGGGAVYWHLEPKQAELNDINAYLMNFYRSVRDDYDVLLRKLQEFVNTKEYFYEVVTKLNNHISGNELLHRVELGAIFYYLNRTAFGGHWRVNKKGLYNLPFGKYEKETYKTIDPNSSRLLQNTTLTSADYKGILESYRHDRNAFIFLDPPYLDCDTMYTESQDFENIYEYLKEYMENSSSKSMLVVKGGQFIENLFEDMIVERYAKKYRVNALSGNEHEHLVICNY